MVPPGKPTIGLLRLVWDDALNVTAADGDALAVASRPPEELVSLKLSSALRVSDEQLAALVELAKKREGGTHFLSRLEGNRHHHIRATVLPHQSALHEGWFLDLDTVLDGAPPVQISRLSSSLSHEIRNPLSSVKMAVQTLARNQELSDRDKRRLSIANREIRTMERMLWVLSEYGRDTRPEIADVQLRALVQDSAAMVEPELAERNVQLNVVEQEPNLKVRVDAQRLRPVLSQLLLNVAMGLETGGKLDVRLAPDGAGALLEVTDTVASVPDNEEAATMFEPFGSRLARGAGLSLAALRRVVRASGGEVSAYGSGVPGTVFRVILPG